MSESSSRPTYTCLQAGVRPRKYNPPATQPLVHYGLPTCLCGIQEHQPPAFLIRVWVSQLADAWEQLRCMSYQIKIHTARKG